MDLIRVEERQGKMETLFSQETLALDQPGDGSPYRLGWPDHFQQEEGGANNRVGENLSSATQERILSPIDDGGSWGEFFPLRVGMKVRHPKFGDGRVRSVEGMDEGQKATILFQTVGSKRMKVRYAHLEILE